MKFLAVILLIIGGTRLFGSLSSDAEEMSVKTLDNLDVPVKIDPKVLIFINAIVGFIEIMCSLYILFA